MCVYASLLFVGPYAYMISWVQRFRKMYCFHVLSLQKSGWYHIAARVFLYLHDLNVSLRQTHGSKYMPIGNHLNAKIQKNACFCHYIQKSGWNQVYRSIRSFLFAMQVHYSCACKSWCTITNTNKEKAVTNKVQVQKNWKELFLWTHNELFQLKSIHPCGVDTITFIQREC